MALHLMVMGGVKAGRDRMVGCLLVTLRWSPVSTFRNLCWNLGVQGTCYCPPDPLLLFLSFCNGGGLTLLRRPYKSM
jgi:hypothetical protein